MDMYKYCENITKINNKALYHTFKLLPYEKSSAIYAAYAFYHSVNNAVVIDNDISKLDSFEDKLKDMINGKYVNDTLFLALKDSMRRFPSSFKPFQDIINGARHDYHHNFIRTEVELEEYCYKVSGTIEVLFNPIVASEKYDKNKAILDIIAKNVGYAIQITHILRDVGKDIKNNRIYLSDEVMKKHGASPRDIMNGVLTVEYVNVLKEYIKKARESYQVLYDNIDLYDKDSRLASFIAAKSYERTLDKIVKNKYNNFSKRHHISRFEYYYLILKYRLIFSFKKKI